MRTTVYAPGEGPDLLRRIARHIEKVGDFDMGDNTICALGHVRQMGIVEGFSPARLGHRDGCACSQCLDYKALAKKTGISVNEWKTIYSNGYFGNDRRKAGKYLRTRAKQLAQEGG